MIQHVGFFYRPGAFTINEAREWVFAYLLTQPNRLPPIVLSGQERPLRDLIAWLGVSWREESVDAALAVEALTPLRSLLIAGEGGYRLALSSFAPLCYVDEHQAEQRFLAKDPLVALADESPSAAFLLAQQAIQSDVSELVLSLQNPETPADAEVLFVDALAILLALRQRQGAPLLRLTQMAPLTMDEALPSIEGLRAHGFLSQAVFNALCLLSSPIPDGAWSVSAHLLWPLSARYAQPAVLFEMSKLRAMNEAYLRALSFEELGDLLHPFLQEKGLWRAEHNKIQWAKLARDELSTLSDVEALRYLVERELAAPSHVEPEAMRVMREGMSLSVLDAAHKYFSSGESDFHALRALIEQTTGAKRKKLFYPLRIALTGQIYGPSFPEVLPFLGAPECLSRVDAWRIFLRETPSS